MKNKTIFRRKNQIYIKKSLIILIALLIATGSIGYNGTKLLNDIREVESVKVSKHTKSAEKIVKANPVTNKEPLKTNLKAEYAYLNGNWSKEQLEVRVATELKIREIADKENFKYTNFIVKLCDCESMLGLKLKNDKGNNPKTSIDEGYFMWNSHWQKEINERCAYNLECEVKEVMKKVNAGYQDLWVCSKIVKGKINFR